MKRFYKTAVAAPVPSGWQVALDGRGVKTQGGAAQVVPSQTLAEALADEWEAQGEDIAASGLVLRDLADFAIDGVAPDPGAVARALAAYAETDTLLYRAPAKDPLAPRQDAVWEPIVRAAEQRWNVHFERVSGVLHSPQPEATLARLRVVLASFDPFALAALNTLTTLSASLIVGLGALEPASDPDALWHAAELEETHQAEHWGRDAEAEDRRARRSAAFLAAARFARLAAEQDG